VAGISRRDLLRFAGVAAVLAACGRDEPATGDRRPTSDPSRLRETDDPPPERREQRGTPPRDEEPEPDEDPEPAPEPEEDPGNDEVAAPVRVEVLCRDAWEAAAPTPGATAHTITGLMLHHSAVVLDDNRQAPERMRLHQRHHQAQGWADIAYHLGVDRNGNVYELRNLRAAGETGTPYDPAGWLLVMAEGNYDEQDPTPEQLDAIAAVMAWGAATFDVDPAAISSHRHHVPTTQCPGDSLYAEVAGGGLAARVTTLLEAGGAHLVSLCGEDGRRRITAIEAGTA
jgi:hypothetical protein